jgi:superfamily II DNA/RNA helicase
MFDPITVALIRTAPALDGLDLEGLSKRLTSAFADIVSARIRLRGEAYDGATSELTETLNELRRLAAAHESYVALLPGRQNRAAAAFVAASAHQTCMLGRSRSDRGSRIDATTVAPEVCATLLFLVAEANADAAECAKRIIPDSENCNPVELVLLLSLKNLAQGRINPIIRASIPEVVGPEADPVERALQALQQMLLRGVRRLAQLLRSPTDVAPSDGEVQTASAIFNQVKQLCIEPIDGVLDAGEHVFSLYPGPLHLANLLLSIERDLLGTALTRVPAPGGVDEKGWWQIIRRMARQRPFLWRNHREAIDKDYLKKGTSSAISFPTGGGKSTLTELKIAAALLREEKVVFLAPTHALVGQTTQALRNIFRNFEVVADLDDEVTFDEVVDLPEVTVTTPERCLMLLSMQPEAFADLGLIVFDECHLLHPRKEDRGRRGLDAMLAILNLTRIAPSADLLLLSAMMKNAGEVAGWLGSLTARESLALDLAWKPTRQVRGCVVYPAAQIAHLNAKLAHARQERPTQRSTPAHVKRELLAAPFGLFSLLQTWSSSDRRDYALLPLLATPQPLETGNARRGTWYLTPNGNKLSGAIAAGAASSEMKTLVFVQTTVFCESCVSDFRARLDHKAVTLNEEEAKWRVLVVEEMGGPEHCYLQIDHDGVLRAGTASHHSLLLREERELHESLFKRRDGIDVLFATSTLAQGMNLPSEVVIICGDSRFDPNADKMQKLEAHELLNAAGRAGRAADGAQGFVLLVPSKVIEFDDQNNVISGHWKELQAIFEQADQCLEIEDPLEGVLDQIHAATVVGNSAYLLSRLPLSDASASADPGDALLRRSFAAYKARRLGDEAWIETRIAAALAARPVTEIPQEGKWIEPVSSSTGVSIGVLQQLVDLADSGGLDGNAAEVMSALIGWLTSSPLLLMDFIRPESLEGLFGDAYKKLPDDEHRAGEALAKIVILLPLWMSGAPLNQLEAAYLASTDKLGRCEYARHRLDRPIQR